MNGTRAPLSVLFLGGGTGGHIAPAIAIAEAVRSKQARARCVFVVSTRPIDRRFTDPAEADGLADVVVPLDARPLRVSPNGLAALAHKWGSNIREIRSLIREERRRAETVRAVSLGGFVAAPAVQACRAEGIEITAVSIDAVAGLASRWIAGRANHRFSVDAPPRGSSKPWRTIGPIVRDSRGVAPDPAVARSELGLDPDKPVLLVTGGSQGARSVNDFVERFLRDGAAALEGWQVLHQSGGPETTDARLTAAYQDTGIEARVTPFVEDMPLAWAAAEFSICRGGASTVAEIRWHRTPSAILPYPHHRDQHQRYNAEPLRDAGGVLLLRDHIDPEANMSAHAGALASVLGDPSARATMRSAIAKLGPCDGAGVIAGVLCGPR